MLRSTLVLLSVVSALHAQVSMTLLANIDVSITSNVANPEYIGNNPSAVAWNGSDLWLAGFNNQGGPGSTAILQVTTPLTAPTFGVPFGVVATTPSLRGYSGLDIRPGQLVAAYDFGTASPEGITSFDLAGMTQWAKNARGSCGVAFDPGFYGILDYGTAYTNFGAAGRALQDNTTGADLYTTASGMNLNPAGMAGYWRDIAFDPYDGAVWLRKSNKVIAAERNGGNSTQNERIVVDATTADLINMQNLAFVRQGSEQVVFWNHRPNAALGQPFATAIRCTRAGDGADLTIDWGGFTAPTGSGAYDFSYDAATGTLAISDFQNRAVYVFAVTAYGLYGTGCVGAGGYTPHLDATGDARAGGTVTYAATQLAPTSVGGFVFGFLPDYTPLPFPGACPQHVTPVLFTAGLFFTGPGAYGSGGATLPLSIPAGLGGVQLTAQAVVLENGDLNFLKTSNGLAVTLR